MRYASSASRRALALRVDGDRLAGHGVPDEPPRVRADQYLACRSALLEPGGDVDGVAGDQRVDLPGHHLARVDADPRGEAERRHRSAHLPGGPHRPQRIVLVRHRHAEHRHHRVTHELLHRAAVALEDHAHPFVVRAHRRAQRLRVDAMAERRRAAQIAEQDRDDLADLTGSLGGRQRRPAAAAEAEAVWVLAAAGCAEHPPNVLPLLREASRLFRAARRVAGAVGVRAGRPRARRRQRSGTPRGSAARRTSTRGSRACRRRSAPAPTGSSRTRAASSRCAASCAMDGLPGPAAGTRRRPRSRPAGRLAQARATASRSQIFPRAVFTRYAPRFIVPISSSSNRCSVSGCSGALIVTTSQTGTSDCGVLVEGEAELLLDLGRQPVPVGVVQADLERLQTPQHRRPDPTRADRADLHALEVVRAGGAVGDVPAAARRPTRVRAGSCGRARGSA